MLKEFSICIIIAVLAAITYCLNIESATPMTNLDLTFSVLIEMIGVGITALFLDQLWHAEERMKWKKVKGDVHNLLNGEIYAIFTDFANFLVPPKVFTITSPDEIGKKTHDYRLAEIRKLAEGNIEEIEKRLRKEEHLLNGDYNDHFHRKYENLNDIEVKWGKFLDPSRIRIMINLERLLKSLQSNLNAKQKLKGTIGESLIPSLEQKIFRRTQDILKMLGDWEKLGLLEYPE